MKKLYIYLFFTISCFLLENKIYAMIVELPDKQETRSQYDREWIHNDMAENNKQLFPLHTRSLVTYLSIQEYADRGADLNYQYNNKTPLMEWAAIEPRSNCHLYSSHLKYAEELLKWGADQNVEINGDFALKIAVRNDNLFMVNLLLKYNPNQSLVWQALELAQKNMLLEAPLTVMIQRSFIVRLFLNHINKHKYQKHDSQENLRIYTNI